METKEGLYPGNDFLVVNPLWSNSYEILTKYMITIHIKFIQSCKNFD